MAKKKRRKSTPSRNNNGNPRSKKAEQKRLMYMLGGAAAIGFAGGTQGGQDLLRKVPRPGGVPPLLLIGGGGLLLKPKGVWRDLAVMSAGIGAFQFGLRNSAIAKEQGEAAAAASLMDVDPADDVDIEDTYDGYLLGADNGAQHDDVARAYAQLGAYHIGALTQGYMAAQPPMAASPHQMPVAEVAEIDMNHDDRPMHAEMAMVDTPTMAETTMAELDAEYYADVADMADVDIDVADVDLGDVQPADGKRPADSNQPAQEPTAIAEVDY